MNTGLTFGEKFNILVDNLPNIITVTLSAYYPCDCKYCKKDERCAFDLQHSYVPVGETYLTTNDDLRDASKSCERHLRLGCHSVCVCFTYYIEGKARTISVSFDEGDAFCAEFILTLFNDKLHQVRDELHCAAMREEARKKIIEIEEERKNSAKLSASWFEEMADAYKNYFPY